MSHRIEFKNSTEGQELYMYGPIDGENGVSAAMVASALLYLGGSDFTLRVHSPGGRVSEGMAIYQLLKDYAGKVTVRIDGMAASMASVISMAGREIIMGEGAMMFVHMPLVDDMSGNAEELRRTADDLDKFEESIVSVYTARTKKTPDEIRAFMRAETYLTAEEAVANGFADRVAKLDAAAFSNSSPMNFFNTFKNAGPMAQAFAAAKIDFTPEAFAALAAKAAKGDEAETLIASAIAAASADVDAAKAQAKDAADKLAAAEAALAKVTADHAAALAAVEADKALAVQQASANAEAKASAKAADLVASLGFKAPIKGKTDSSAADATNAKEQYANLLNSNPTEAAKFYRANKAQITSNTR